MPSGIYKRKVFTKMHCENINIGTKRGYANMLRDDYDRMCKNIGKANKKAHEKNHYKYWEIRLYKPECLAKSYPDKIVYILTYKHYKEEIQKLVKYCKVITLEDLKDMISQKVMKERRRKND